jgi:hypothetical protein
VGFGELNDVVTSGGDRVDIAASGAIEIRLRGVRIDEIRKHGQQVIVRVRAITSAESRKREICKAIRCTNPAILFGAD